MDKLSKLLLCAVCLSVLTNAVILFAMWAPDQDVEPVSQAVLSGQVEEATIAVNQDMQVINGSGKDMWVRVKVEIPELNGKKVFQIVSNTIAQKADAMKSEHWISGEDGYYYYSQPVRPGEQSVPLFNSVKELPMDVCYIPGGDKIKVKAQAIQINWVSSDVSTGEDAFEHFDATPVEDQVAQLM